MKYILTYIFFFIACFSVFGQDKGEEAKLNDVLKELDEVIEHKQDYRVPRQHQIDSLRMVLSRKMTEEKQAKALNEIYLIYSHYKADSALFYLDKMAKLDVVKGDENLLTQNTLNRIEEYAIMGAYSSSLELLDNIRLNAESSYETRIRFYHVCRTVYGWMSSNSHEMPVLRNEWIRKTQLYRDSIISAEKDVVSRDVVIADNFIQKGESDKAFKVLKKHMESVDDQQRAYVHFNLSEVYRLREDKEKQMLSLAYTAINDIERGITEYSALQKLSSLLYENGDVVRAYTYLLCSMEDASLCKASLRSMEISNIYPIIEKSYEQHVEESQMTEHILLAGLSLLLISLVGILIFLRKEMQKLSQARGELALLNKELQKANVLKEEYIAIYLGKCRHYMESLEVFRKKLLKLAKGKQQDEMMKLLKDDALIEKDQQKFFSDFDDAFLDIHPHFVEDFNALLNEEGKITLKKGERMNTELRIFALIRLGVTDTQEISSFLGYSMPTIYNYRSRIRNKSILSKEEFDKKIMEL